MKRKKYNLRSAKGEGVQIPIQLQLLEDNEFLKNLLEVKRQQVNAVCLL